MTEISKEKIQVLQSVTHDIFYLNKENCNLRWKNEELQKELFSVLVERNQLRTELLNLNNEKSFRGFSKKDQFSNSYYPNTPTVDRGTPGLCGSYIPGLYGGHGGNMILTSNTFYEEPENIWERLTDKECVDGNTSILNKLK